MNAKVEAEAREFAQYFFNQVTDRIDGVSEYKRDYTLPTIHFTTQRTGDEDSKLADSKQAVKKTASEIARSGTCLPERDALRSMINSHVGYDVFAEIEALTLRLPNGTPAIYDDGRDLVLIDQTSEEEHLTLLAHELLHSARHKALPYREKNEGYSSAQREVNWLNQFMGALYGLEQNTDIVTPEVTEFFSLQTPIILESVCSNHDRYAVVVGKDDHQKFPRLAEFEGAESYFKGNPEGKLIEILKSYAALIGEAKRAVKGKKEVLLSEIRGYTDFDNKIGAFSRNYLYLILVSGMSDDDIKILEDGFDNLKDPFKSILGITKCSAEANIAYALESFADLWVIGDLASTLDNTPPYIKANLAIGENIDRVRQEWPRLFSMPAKIIAEQYIDPVIGRLAVIIKTGTVKRLKRAIARKRISYWSNKAQKYIEEQQKDIEEQLRLDSERSLSRIRDI